MRWRRRHTVGVVAAIIATGFYGYCLHRSIRVKDAEGWHLRFSYQPFHCEVCLGRVESLTHEGREVAIPDWSWETDDGTTPVVVIHTAVGDFRAFKESLHWRLASCDLLLDELDCQIAPEELSRGWYDARPIGDQLYTYGPYIRKQGTPPNWCLLATCNQARWVRPDLISELEW